MTDDQEFDAYDNEKAQYLVWCSADRETVYGVVRLIPTSAPTLLFDVFDRTHNNDQSLVSDTIYEGTRMCLDDDMIAEDFPTMAPGAGFTLSVSNSSSGRRWKLDHAPAVGDPTHMVEFGTGRRAFARKA